MAKLKGGTRIYGNATVDTTLTAQDVTILGNLNIQGTTTTIDTTVSSIIDPVITLGADANGNVVADGLDRGLVLRSNVAGVLANGFMGWDSTAGEFAFADTTTFTASNNSVVIGTYGNVKAGHFIGEGDTLANISGAAVTGTVASANMSAYAGNVVNAEQANITSLGTLTELDVSNVANFAGISSNSAVTITDTTAATDTSTGALIVSGGAAIGGNLHVGGNIYGSFSGTIAAKGNDTEIQFNDDGDQNAVPQFTFNKSGNILTVAGNIVGGNFSTAGTLDVTGNANVGNLGTAGLISATGNVSGGNLTTGGAVDATGNVSGGNLTTAGVVSATGNVSGGNLTTTGDVTTVTVTASGNISTTANLSVSGNATITGSVDAAGGFTTGANIDGTGGSSALNIKYIEATGTANITSTLTAGNLSTGGAVDATGNVTGGNLVTTGSADIGNLVISGNVQGHLIPSADVTYDLGADGAAWRDLWLSGSSIKIGSQTITSNTNGVALSNTIFATNITASNSITSGNTITANGAITGANVTANNLSNTHVVFANADKTLTSNSAFTFTDTTGTLKATLFEGALNVNSNAQPNITSVGTLIDLTVTNVANANISGYAATVSASAQSNITSVGTLTSLEVSGNIQSNANVITNNIIAKDTNMTLTAGTGGNIVLAPEGSGTVDVSNKRITGLATPTDASDAATKGYVDGASQGLDIKNSVRVATTADIALDGSVTSIDGVTLATDDRVLVKNQTLANQNGIYVVPASGNWSRAEDADQNGELTAGSFTFVEEGTTNADSGWVVSTDGEIVIGTDSISWTQFSGAGQLSAGAGLSLTGGEFSVVVDDSTIAIVSGSLQVKDSLTLVTPNIGAATGDSLDINGGNLTVDVVLANSVSIQNSGNITGANVISATTLTGTLSTSAQTNITSVGTLGNANVATTLNVASNAFIANASGIYTDGYYYANGVQIDFQTAAGNAFELQFHADGTSDLASSANLTFDGSLLTVTGTANVSGSLTAGNLKASSLTSGRIVFATTDGELADNSDLTYTAGLFSTSDANISNTLTAGNIIDNGLTSSQLVFAGASKELTGSTGLTFDSEMNELQSANANVAGYMTAGNVTARNLENAGRIVIAGSAGLLSDNANLSFDTLNDTFNVQNANIANTITAAQFIGNGVQISNIAGGNVSGTVENANVAVTVSGNAQSNITSVGTLTSLTVSGLTDLGDAGNLTLTGGTTGQYLKTDGSGNLSWGSVSSDKISNGTSEVSIPTVDGNIEITRGGTLVLTVTGTGANVTGYIDVTGNINGNNISAANTISANANTDSTSSITGTITVTGGMAATGNIYTGHSVGFANNNGGTASKAYIQYNDTANSLDFIFN